MFEVEERILNKKDMLQDNPSDLSPDTTNEEENIFDIKSKF